MRASDPEIANLIAVSEPCAGCVLAEGHSASPDFIEPSISHQEYGGIETKLTVSSHNGKLKTTEIDLPRVLRKDQVIEQLNTPIGEKAIACNALCAMILKRRGY